MKPGGTTKTAGAGFGRYIILWGLVFLVLIALTGLFFWQGNKFDRIDRETTDLASDIRLMSQQMTTQALSAAQGQQQSFLLLKQLKNAFSGKLEKLSLGDAAEGIPPFPAELAPELEKVNERWKPFSSELDAVLNSRGAGVPGRGAAPGRGAGGEGGALWPGD